jgi:isoprenylcysteine carboxyl methyltransferase (ICMT) family protein YpbQ
MDLYTIERWIGWAGAAAIVALTIVVLIGFGRGRRRVQGRASGAGLRFLRLPMWAYLLIILIYAGLCYLLWRPLPLSWSPAAQVTALVIGSLLYFPSLGLILWARHTMGEMYNISLTTGAQLYAGHRLISRGPFAIIRHPMYAGAMLGVTGALLIYHTWTIVFILVHCLVFFVRAGREEEALAAEFGEEWMAYSKRVPGWIPRLGRR